MKRFELCITEFIFLHMNLLRISPELNLETRNNDRLTKFRRMINPFIYVCILFLHQILSLVLITYKIHRMKLEIEFEICRLSNQPFLHGTMRHSICV